MAKGNKLLKDTFIYGVANFGSKILTFIMLPLYTHYFTTNEYGLWDLIITTSTLLIPFITFELVASVYRWLLDVKNEEDRISIITTGAITILRNLLIFNVFAVIIISFVSIPYEWEALALLNVIVISSFIQQCARGLGFNKLFASLGIIQTIITVSSILFFIFVLELRLEAFFYSSIIGGIGVVMVGWIVMGFSNYLAIETYSKTMVKSFLVYSIPIIPGAISWWIMNMSDRYFIILYMGMEYNGIYAVANKIPALLLMINTVFFLAWKDSAIVEFHSADKDEYYSKVFKHFFRLMATSVICITLFAKPVMEWIIADAFFSSWKYIGILLLGALFSAFSQFWGAGYHGAKKTNVIFVTSLAGALVNVLVNLFFVEHLGLYAVALSTFLAFLTMWIIRVIAAKRYFTITINYKEMLLLLPITLGAIIAPFVFGGAGMIICMLLGIILFLTYNRGIIKLVFRTAVSALNALRKHS